MEIFPAIDLRGGRVVRLTEGDYSQMQAYSDDPVQVARSFKAQGAKFLHVVDLDGAKDGAAANFATIEDIVRHCNLTVQVGGGIRTGEQVKQYLDLGASRVILGTAAVEEPVFLVEMLALHGDRIAVSVDARDGKVAVNGWQEVTGEDSIAFCASLARMGVPTIIYTDISKDGKLTGTNLEVYQELSQKVDCNIIASGGVSFEEEVVRLAGMNIYGAIVGKALYEKKLDLKRVIELAKAGGTAC